MQKPLEIGPAENRQVPSELQYIFFFQMEGEGERRDMREKSLNGRGHKIIKRQKAMTLFTFKPNSLIKGRVLLLLIQHIQP